MTLRIVVAEDELMARRRIVRLLEAIPDVEVAGAHESAQGVLDQVAREPVDVLVLDVQMPGLSGTELHAVLGDAAPFVIFATAHPEHAVEAFELGAVDYVLKPIEAARLARAVDRARGHRQKGPAEGRPLPISTRAGVVLLAPEAISHALFDGSLVTVFSTDSRTHLTDASLQDLQDKLPADSFERVHRRALLNLAQIRLLRPTESGGYVAETEAGAEVPVSRQAARKLRKWLGLRK